MFKSLRLVFVVFDRKCLSARSDGKGISRPGKLFTCCGGRNAVHCFFCCSLVGYFVITQEMMCIVKFFRNTTV